MLTDWIYTLFLDILLLVDRDGYKKYWTIAKSDVIKDKIEN